MPRPAAGRNPPPTTVPSTPPAAAPMTAPFTLRPVAAPMIAPVAAPRIPDCVRLGPRRAVGDGTVDSGAEGCGRACETTSPSAAVPLAATSTGGCAGVVASATL